MSVTRKKIRIPFNGPIYGKHGLYGPITVPFLEEVSVIGSLLIQKTPVIEVHDDGTETVLNLNNFNIDNTPVVVEEKKQEEAVVDTIKSSQNNQNQRNSQPNEQKKNIKPDVTSK
ncbi:hypothetical protein D1872_37860 [compost metagenome]